MTLQQYQQILHSLYQGDVEYPTSADDEWTHRTNLLAAGIAAWGNEKGILWSELWKMNSDGDGDTTVVAATLDYDCGSDFRFPGGFVKTVDSGGLETFWEVISPQKAELYVGQGVKKCYFTGNKATGFDLHFLSQPTAGHTIEYPYYKEPATVDDAAEVIEMSDPYFAIYFALSKLHEIDGEGDRSTKALQEAQARLLNMRTRNIMPAWYQDNKTADRDWDLGTGGFGV